MMLRHLRRSVKTAALQGTVAASSPHQHPCGVSVRRDDLETTRFKVEMGARIREARESAEIETPAELARRVDADRGTVARWEAGEGAPDAVNLKAISDVTKTSADWLLRGFVSPAWRETYERWSAGMQLEPRARIWIESLPLDGYEPSTAFYDLVYVSLKHGLTPSRAIQMANENLQAKLREQQLADLKNRSPGRKKIR